MSRTETDQKYQDLIGECDRLIKAGKINQVIEIISNLVLSQVPRSARHDLAKCCRRTGLISLGLRLLHPVIRGQKFLKQPVNANEVCEYSALLARHGSVAEAIDLLKTVDPTIAPEALLYLGQCHILNWDYAEAIECFTSFLASTADDYSKLIARVNLISGYIVLFQLKEATEILEETVALVQRAGAKRLLANCYELWGQVYFWQHDFPKSRQMLKWATGILDNAQSHDQLLILKTEAIMAALEENSAEPLIELRKLAVQRKHWECVRDADLFLQKVQPDQHQLDHLVFGSPKVAFRRRIETLVEISPSSSYVLGNQKGPQLNLQTGRVTGVDSLPLGKQIHQVISALNRDFYVPTSVGALFHELYPEEYFDIDTSPFRIRQAILRTREWLQKNNIPAVIQQAQGSYRFLITGDFGICIELEQQAVNPTIVRWRQLKERFAPGLSFSSEEACYQMGWSRTTFRRLAEWACQNGQLDRFGVGKATLYQIHSGSRQSQHKKGS
jgi:tetratricopeptide (TPR) repeat protein